MTVLLLERNINQPWRRYSLAVRMDLKVDAESRNCSLVLAAIFEPRLFSLHFAKLKP